MNQDKYLQSYTGNIYKVMDQYLLQLSPWKDGDDRRLYSYDDSNMTVITYKNACMIVNKQFAETDEEWEHNGKKYKARALVNKDINEHAAMLSMLPSHYLKESTKLLKTLPDDNSISIQNQYGDEFKLVKHKGKVYYCLIINHFLPKVQLYNTFGKFCQMVNIKNVKPIFNETDKRYI
jgi:aspartyl/asparaginyl-tRNA synthetase